jgi:hypothetical protein
LTGADAVVSDDVETETEVGAAIETNPIPLPSLAGRESWSIRAEMASNLAEIAVMAEWLLHKVSKRVSKFSNLRTKNFISPSNKRSAGIFSTLSVT